MCCAPPQQWPVSLAAVWCFTQLAKLILSLCRDVWCWVCHQSWNRSPVYFEILRRHCACLTAGKPSKPCFMISWWTERFSSVSNWFYFVLWQLFRPQPKARITRVCSHHRALFRDIGLRGVCSPPTHWNRGEPHIIKHLKHATQS